MHWRTSLLATAFVCVGLAANAGNNAGPFLGPWTITEAKPVPWATPSGQPNASLLNAKMAFGRNRLDGPAPFTCSKAVYFTEPRGPKDLFSGRLSDPDREARELGFGDRVVILSTGCQSGETNTVPDIALADERTAMFTLDNFIYVMKR